MTNLTVEELTARINELAKKNRECGLTEEETAERDALRSEYIRRFRESLTAGLDSVYYIGDDGKEHKLAKKEK